MLFPGLSGNWEKDKARFIRIWGEHQRLLKEASAFNSDKN
jgi:hypothetical protein